MSNIEVSKIIDPIPASDGAGVKLKRSIGVEPNYFDPFLMLDEFGSENSEDYIAGFPPHPHRNKILGRVSTDQEIEFLKRPNSSW